MRESDRPAGGPVASKPHRWAEHLRPRLASLRLSPSREAEIIEEFSQHLDERYAELRASGASDAKAHRIALDDLSDPEALARHMASLRQSRTPVTVTPGASRGSFFADLWQDLRYGGRTFRKQSGFAAAVVVTLGLGIGASTAIFSVVYGVLLKPLPYPEPDGVVAISHYGILDGEVTGMNHGPATYFTYVDNQRAFEHIGGWDRTEVTITGGNQPERVAALAVTQGTLPALGVEPVLGRFFSADDDIPGSRGALVLTHAYWQDRMGGDPGVIGRTLQVDGEPADVIGVLPASFRFPRSEPVVLTPLQPDRADADGAQFGFQVIGRLGSGITLEAANADIARMIPTVNEIPGHAGYELQPDVYPLIQYARGEVGRTIWILFATVGIVLMIACANVANLFLVRAEGRQQELAVRSVLGASRGRLSREIVTESLVLGIVGGALGLGLAAGAAGLLRRIAPATLPRAADIGIDPPVLLFTLGVSVVASLLLGLLPAMRVAPPTSAMLKEGGRGASEGPARQRTRAMLIVGEIAMAFVLLITSGLMVRTFAVMREIEPGFVQPGQVQTFRVDIPEAIWGADEERMIRMHAEIADRLRQLPGVTSVGMASSVTMDGEDNANPIQVERDPPCVDDCWDFRRLKTVAPGHFETMGNPIIAGRDVTWADVYEKRLVVVVSEAMARETWGGAIEALGRRVKPFEDGMPWREVVGVVGDERDDGLDRPATAIVYWPLWNDGFWDSSHVYAVRSNRVGSPGFVDEIRETVWSVHPDLPISSVLTLEEIRGDSMASTSFAMVMLALAAGVALVLGVVGIYSVIAYIAALRTREIGIRMALGAQIADVRRMFLRYGLRLTVVGIAVGIGAAMLLTRAMSALLFGVASTDPVTYVVVSVALALIALAATDLPARRAARVDPIVALRGDA